VRVPKACDEGENGENRVAGSAIVGELILTPACASLEVALHLVEPDVDSVGEDEVPQMLRKNGRIHT
jgi:hypothetical protein